MHNGAVGRDRALGPFGPVDRHPNFGDTEPRVDLYCSNDRGKHGSRLVAQLSFRFGIARKLIAYIRHVITFYNDDQRPPAKTTQNCVLTARANDIVKLCYPQVPNGPRGLGPMGPSARPEIALYFNML